MAQLIELATNLFSLPLDSSQQRLAIQRLLEVYKKRHPVRTLTGRWLHGEGFAKVLETTLGIKPAQAHRLANTAEHIDNENRDTLEAAGVSQTKIDDIAQLKEPKAIKTATSLAAAGKDVDEAIRQGKKVKAVKKNKSKADKAENADQRIGHGQSGCAPHVVRHDRRRVVDHSLQ